MKKFTAILLTLVLALSLAACGSDTTTASDGEGTTAPATEPQDTTTQEDTNAGTASVDTGRTLVVYFSATGNTQTAAETIRPHRRGPVPTGARRPLHRRGPELDR